MIQQTQQIYQSGKQTYSIIILGFMPLKLKSASNLIHTKQYI